MTSKHRLAVEHDCYFDSVYLMRLSLEMKEIPSVTDATAAMGTESNREWLRSQGYDDPELEAAGPGDLLLALEGENSASLESAIVRARGMLHEARKPSSGITRRPPATLEQARQQMPQANLVIISTPGRYAAREALRALDLGLHVMLFSDHVSLEEEIALKQRALQRGLLMMGPDCGTAILNGKPLCFANIVRRGSIGIVGASGTGIQEVSCAVDRLGGGISQAIGTGGRDLSREVGGLMALAAIDALQADPATKVLVVISKPPAAEVSELVIERLAYNPAKGDRCKPAVVYFSGVAASPSARSLHWAGSLEEAARLAVTLSLGEAASVDDALAADVEAIAEREVAEMLPDQRYLRGFYSGGTLAREALFLCRQAMGSVYSNMAAQSAWELPDPRRSVGDCIVDLGDDIFTLGRPHPMIDPTLRGQRILEEAGDSTVGVLLLDCVLGYGSHPDPAGALAQSITQAKTKVAERGGYLSVVASITGTERDPQGLGNQLQKLLDAGCQVAPSNFQAAKLALAIRARRGS